MSSDPADPSDLPASWDVEDAEVSRRRSKAPLVVGALIGALVLAGVVFGVARQEEKTKTAWPQSYSGPPPGLSGPPAQASADVVPGYYVWSDFNGWHLRVVNGNGVAGATGSITSNDEIAEAKAATAGEGTVTKDDKTATFDLPADPRVVGVDFNPGFYGDRLTIELTDADGTVDRKLVTVGNTVKPDELPMVLEKVPEDEAPTS